MDNTHHIDIINSWLISISKNFQLPDNFTIQAIAGDASVRKYYLLLPKLLNSNNNQPSFIIMQTPTDSSLENFINIANYLKQLDFNIPTIFDIHKYKANSYLLLSYLGDNLLYSIININNANNIYNTAWATLAKMQTNTQNHHSYIKLKAMDKNYIRENLLIFKKWYLEQHLNLYDLHNIDNILNTLENYFANIFKQQPQVFVHLDYHSKNLILNTEQLGIIDFQDAMYGPITYDIVSLLQDAYLIWPEQLIQKILLEYFNHIKTIKNFDVKNLKFQEFLRYFYLTGLQRHIKNLGIFARLKYFYKKDNYLQYIPNLLNYINNTCNKLQEPELIMIQNLLENIVCKQ